MKANITIEHGGYVNWEHMPAPKSVQSADVAVVRVEDAPADLVGDNAGVRRLHGVSPGTVKLNLSMPDNTVLSLVVEVIGADIVTPTVTIDGPLSINVGSKATYTAVVSGGKYERIESYEWSCGASGETGSTAIVDATNRPEGLIQICCTVTVLSHDGNGGARSRAAAGSIQVQIEEPD